AVLAEQRMYLAGLDIERDVRQCGNALEMFRDAAHRQGRLPGAARLHELKASDNGCVGHACPHERALRTAARRPPHASRGIATSSPASLAPAESALPTGRCRPAGSAGTRRGWASR